MESDEDEVPLEELIDVSRMESAFEGGKRMLTPADMKMIEFLNGCYVPFSIILTKVDLLGKWEYIFNVFLKELEEVISNNAMAEPYINVTSARLHFGVTELQCLMGHKAGTFKREDFVEGLEHLIY